MAVVTFQGILRSDNSARAGSYYPGPDAVNSAVAAIVYTSVAADIATLVADGATPTQAHVTTLNTHWTALKALIDTAVALAPSGAPSGNAVFSIDIASITTVNQLEAVIRAIRDHVEAANLLTR